MGTKECSDPGCSSVVGTGPRCAGSTIAAGPLPAVKPPVHAAPVHTPRSCGRLSPPGRKGFEAAFPLLLFLFLSLSAGPHPAAWLLSGVIRSNPRVSGGQWHRALAYVEHLHPRQLPPVGPCEGASLVLCRTHGAGGKGGNEGVLSALPVCAQHSRDDITLF